LKEFKYRKDVLERKKELWLQNQETKRNIIDKMSINIVQMKSMIAREEFRQHKAKKEEEKVVLEVLTLQKEIFKIKRRLDYLLEKYKDLDYVYVNNRLEEYDYLVQYYTILHIKQHMEDSNVELDEWWELEKHNSRKKCNTWLHT
jgi:hypothetical protein